MVKRILKTSGCRFGLRKSIYASVNYGKASIMGIKYEEILFFILELLNLKVSKTERNKKKEGKCKKY